MSYPTDLESAKAANDLGRSISDNSPEMRREWEERRWEENSNKIHIGLYTRWCTRWHRSA